MNLSLYCNSFGGKDPLHTQGNQKTLMCGSHNLDNITKQNCINKGYILDDTLYNISHLNYLLGDLTGLYWIWKNANDEFLGTNQYCRFYDDQQLQSLLPLDKNSLYVFQFLSFGESVWHQYIASHTDLGMKLLTKAIEQKTIPLTQKMFNDFFHTNRLSPCNTFFTHKTLLDKTCQILFDIIFELYEGSKYLIEFVQFQSHAGRNPNDKRLLAFLAERILNIIYFNAKYFLGNIQIVPVNYYYKHG